MKQSIILHLKLYQKHQETPLETKITMDMIIKSNINTLTYSGDYKFIRQDQIAYRYELIEKLGHGSFGYVYKVMDHKHH